MRPLIMTNKQKLKELTCQRCGWVWTPRKKNPVSCPRCRSYLWNKKKKEE